MEDFVPGEFQKYVNNDGICYASVTEYHQEVYAKAECLVHFSYTFSEKKCCLIFKVQCSNCMILKLLPPNLHGILTNRIFVPGTFSRK